MFPGRGTFSKGNGASLHARVGISVKDEAGYHSRARSLVSVLVLALSVHDQAEPHAFVRNLS